jgi:hypothetical protein
MGKQQETHRKEGELAGLALLDQLPYQIESYPSGLFLFAH